MVVRQGMALIVAGLVVGMAAAFAVVRLLGSWLFEVSPMDPVTFVTVSLFIAAVGLVACLVPAWRATRVDPVVTLNAGSSV